MNNDQKILCVDCHAEINVEQNAQKGEVITCPECSADLEILQLNPVKLGAAPEVQEDWGQ